MTSRTKTGSSARLVLAARVLLLLLAGALALWGFVLVWRDEPTSSRAGHDYVCPMHPEITATAPAECPICRMRLEPVARVDMARAHTAAQKRDSAVRSPSSIASSYAPGVTWLPETFPPARPGDPGNVPGIGSVERRVFVKAVRAAAWLEAADRLAAVLYRDELVGLSLDEGGTFFRAASPRTGIEVRRSGEPATRRDGSTSLVRFVLAARKVSPHAISTANGADAQELRSGEVGWLELPAKQRELSVFPESALLGSSESAYVLVPGSKSDSFTRRPVEIGRIFEGHVVVFSGLHLGDRLVVGDAFFLDAQLRSETGAAPLAKAAAKATP